MAEDAFFYSQAPTRKPPKRYRKLPEELPESLRFVHLPPRVAALMMKERANKQELEDPFGDGLGKKSLLPDINQTFQSVKSRLDSALSNDEDSQRFLFEEAKISAAEILTQLAKYIYYYEDIYTCIPKSLEYQLLCTYKELTCDIIYVHREWQTLEMKEQHAAAQQKEAAGSEEESIDKGLLQDGSIRPHSQFGRTSDISKFKKSGKAKMSIESSEDGEAKEIHLRPPEHTTSTMLRAYPSKLRSSMLSLKSKSVMSSTGLQSRTAGMSAQSLGVRGKRDHDLISMFAETPDARSTMMANPAMYYQTYISFQLSNKAFEEKGWIVKQGIQEEVDPRLAYNECIQILNAALKQINDDKVKEEEKGFNQTVVFRYYGDTRKETLLKYRKSPVKQTPTPITKVVKPSIPILDDEKNEGKTLVQTTHLDGTTVVYYPSGRPAVIYSASGLGRAGYYTIVYEDGLDSKMLACFTPTGRGVCFHANGIASFLATEKGGHLTTANGSIERKWKWPASTTKMASPVVLTLNNHLGFKCTSHNQMVIFFHCQKETARFPVGVFPNAVEYKPNENEHLLTAFTFSSRAARELVRILQPKSKQKKSKLKKLAQGGLSKPQQIEIQKLIQDMPDRVMYDIDAEKELARLQRRARNLIDDWMEHYRIALGLKSPHLKGVEEARISVHGQRMIKSAVQSDQTTLKRQLTWLGLGPADIVQIKKVRAPSAPLGKEVADVDKNEFVEKKKDAAAVSFDGSENVAQEGLDLSALNLLNRLTASAEQRSARSKALSASPRKGASHSQPEQSFVYTRSLCTFVIRQHILGFDGQQCRCSRHVIPFIMDVEYDEFIQKEVPEGQLIIIAVVSSLFPGVTESEEMCDSIYQNQNRNRTRPCIQSRSDIFRILKYDINTAAEMSDHTEPLLLTRHNVVPGMFLMYQHRSLIFCDHIFNGYGNARKDFKKQIMKSRIEALQGHSLPKDFKFREKGQKVSKVNELNLLRKNTFIVSIFIQPMRSGKINDVRIRNMCRLLFLGLCFTELMTLHLQHNLFSHAQTLLCSLVEKLKQGMSISSFH
ncbi:hypothetical protein ACJMK2_015718 [Sinanodonta woodiana]|uniref:FAM194 C-terminal domain-containing protein n=1 Tax=Sinanodonta woodiana TaxID=1069815 RepID=A0ABD3UR99_SINWO